MGLLPQARRSRRPHRRRLRGDHPRIGSEASNSCVISNNEEHLKCGINTDLNRPAIAFLDPELTFTLPAYQTAAGVTDMIAHTWSDSSPASPPWA